MSEIQTSISFAQKTRLLDHSAKSVRVENTSDRVCLRGDDKALEQLIGTAGYSVIPNLLLDKLRGILERNEYDVFMYIFRRTIGFHKLSDAISLSQFQNGIVTFEGRRLDWGCGLKGVDTINRALKALEKHGFIIREHRTAANGAFASNVFTICPEVVLRALTEQVIAAEEKAQEAVAGSNQEMSSQWDKSTNMMSSELLPIEVIPANSDEQSFHDGFSSTEEGVNLVEDNASHNLEEGLVRVRGDKTQASKNKSDKKSNMGGFPVVDLSEGQTFVSERVAADSVRLVSIGFDNLTAKRLALIAEKMVKPVDYINAVITYSQKAAITNPAGLVRWLIEHAVDVDSKNASFGKKKRFLPDDKGHFAYGVARATKVKALLPPVQEGMVKKESFGTTPCKLSFSREELEAIWQEVYQSLNHRFNSSELAQVLAKARLVNTRLEGESLVALLKLEEHWQKRLFTPGNLALIELVLGQKFGYVTSVKFYQ